MLFRSLEPPLVHRAERAASDVLAADKVAWLREVDDVSRSMSPEVRQVVIADPDHAPFGAAARQALQHAGLWDGLQDKLVFSGSALQALEVISTGNAQAGLLPASLLTHSELVSAPVPPDLYTPPQYAAAIPWGGNPAHARAFLERLMSPAGRAVMVANGLAPVTPQ